MPKLATHTELPDQGSTDREFDNIYRSLGSSGGGDMLKSIYDTGNVAKNIFSLSGSGAPATTPEYIGQEYLDTSTLLAYKAFGVSSSSDWQCQVGGLLQNHQYLNNVFGVTNQMIFGCRIQCTKTGVIKTLSAGTYNNGTYKMAVYSDSSNYPNTLLCSTNAYSQTINGLTSIPIITPIIITVGTIYWIALLSSVAPTLFYDQNANHAYAYYKAIGTTTLPTTFPAGATGADNYYMFQAQ